jgi:N,N-dimethylformamidase
MPPHRAISVPGVHAYPDRESMAVGETLRLRVSSSLDYDLSICKLGSSIDSRERDQVLATVPNCRAAPRPIYPGSYVAVASGLVGNIESITLELWVRPWACEEAGGLLHQAGEARAAFELRLEPGGTVMFAVGGGRITTGSGVVTVGEWQHVAAVWGPAGAAVYVDAIERVAGPGGAVGSFTGGTLRIGAGELRGLTDRLLDGDIAAPAIHGRALSAREIGERRASSGLRPPLPEALQGYWPLDEEGRAGMVADRSGHGRDGVVVNHGTWMIGGPAFEADKPIDTSYDVKADATRGHGLRLASDDLFDCGWPVEHEWHVPEDAASGFYVARFTYEMDGERRHYDVTFVVRKAHRAEPAPVVVLCSSNTWRAYNATPFAASTPDDDTEFTLGGSVELDSHPPAYSLYRNHAAGQGTLYLGTQIPWPAAGPYVRYDRGTDYSHLVRAERYTHVWLRETGYDFDPITDLDLHHDPDLLKDYKVLLIPGHPEYWSTEMWTGVARYLDGGGDMVVLAGNAVFWRVTIDEHERVIECRKVDASSDQIPPERRGEAWHSQDGKRGGMLYRSGYLPWDLVGLDSLGWIDHDNAANFGWFVADHAEHFLFHEPNETGVSEGEEFGRPANGGLPSALAHEFDLRASAHYALRRRINPAMVEGEPEVVDPPGMIRLAGGHVDWSAGGVLMGFFPGSEHPELTDGGEIIYWERETGGRIFNAGTIGYGWAMSADPRLGMLLDNVLRHFGVTPREDS